MALTVSCKKKPPQLVSDPITGARITVPRDFRVGTIAPGNEAVNAHFKLQASNVFKDIGVGVTIESKMDIAARLTLAEYIELASAKRESIIKRATREEHLERRVNGRPAVQELVRGSAGNANIVYMIMYVEDDANYYQVTGWTTPSRLAANRPIIQGVLDSFVGEPYGSQ